MNSVVEWNGAGTHSTHDGRNKRKRVVVTLTVEKLVVVVNRVTPTRTHTHRMFKLKHPIYHPRLNRAPFPLSSYFRFRFEDRRWRWGGGGIRGNRVPYKFHPPPTPSSRYDYQITCPFFLVFPLEELDQE